MFPLGNKKSSTTYGAIIDIGSGSVGVGIVESDHTEPLPKLIYTHRELMRINQEQVDREEKLRQMRETFFSAGLALSTDGLKELTSYNKNARIRRILVTVSSPWAHTVSRKISYTHEKPVKVSRSLIENLVTDTEERAEEELNQSGIVGELGLHVVERATVDTRINGYDITDPIGLTGTEIELSHIIGLIPEEILETVYEIQEKVLTDTKLSAHTFMLVNYCIIRDVMPKTHSLCIVDVTGESTEVGLVSDGTLLETRHAPYGSHTLLRDVSHSANATAEHALSLIRGYVEETLSKEEHERVEKYIEPFMNEVKSTCRALRQTQTIPSLITVTALPQLEDFFKKTIPLAIKDTTESQHTLIETTREALKEMPSFANDDLFIGLGSRFFHKLHGCGEIDTL
jgi:hypothetical protein